MRLTRGERMIRVVRLRALGARKFSREEEEEEERKKKKKKSPLCKSHEPDKVEREEEDGAAKSTIY